MNWFEKFSEEILTIPAYFFWRKFVESENQDENSDENEN